MSYTFVYFSTSQQWGWSVSMFKISLVNNSSFSSTCSISSGEYNEDCKGNLWEGKDESRSKAYLTPTYPNVRLFMYNPSKLCAVLPISPSTVTVLRIFVCLYAFYTFSLLPSSSPPTQWTVSNVSTSTPHLCSGS